MSIELMARVWNSLVGDPIQKIVLIAYADHADDEGYNIFPSIRRVAWKTELSERTVQNKTKELLALGYLVRDGYGPHHTNKYRINPDALPGRQRFNASTSTASASAGGARPAPKGCISEQEGGARPAPESSEKELTIIKTLINANDEKVEQTCEPSSQPLTAEYYRQALEKPLDDRQTRMITAMVEGAKAEEGIRAQLQKRFYINIDARNRRWGMVIRWLKTLPVDQTVDQFADWWYRVDWRGKENQPPTPEQIKELWPQAFKQKALDAQRFRVID